MSEEPGQRYEAIGGSYARTRQTDTRIARLIWRALGDAESVVNVGAGSGSYEPEHLRVIPVEPSATMAAQRAPERPALIATAEELPLKDDSVDAAMAVLTVHHWSDIARGLDEMRRVARSRVVVMSLDPQVMRRSWSRTYWPVLEEMDATFPTPALLADLLGGAEISTIPIPADCSDLFIESTCARPELLLDAGMRANCSGFARMETVDELAGVEALRRDLESGLWDERNGYLRTVADYDGGMRLIVAER